MRKLRKWQAIHCLNHLWSLSQQYIILTLYTSFSIYCYNTHKSTFTLVGTLQ